MFDSIWNLITNDIAIDLGTATTLVAVKGVGVVIEEPSVVAVNKQTRQVLAVGEAAKKMLGRTPANMLAIRPLRDGVISDFDTAEALIRYFMGKVFQEFGGTFKLNRPRVVIGIPSLITEVEARAVVDAAKSAGAREVYVVSEPVVAAIGAGLAIEEAAGSMIVDIGGGTTDIALLSLSGVVTDNTIKIAGDEMDEAIAEYAKHKYNLLVGERAAEKLKIEIGSAYPLKEEVSAEIGGRDLVSGLPKAIEMSSVEVREALDKVLTKIYEAIKEAIEVTAPEVLGDLLTGGIMLAGGGAQLRGLDKYLADKLKVPVKVADQPTKAVVNGAFKLLDNLELLRKVQLDEREFL